MGVAIYLMIFLGAAKPLRAEEQRAHIGEETRTHQERELRDSLSLEEAQSIFSDLKKNRRFRMFHPGAHCYSRSQLIGRNLEERGLLSHQLYIDCSGELIAGVTPENKIYAQYGDHWTNVVWIQRGRSRAPYVLDPQFKDEIVPLVDYIRSVVVPGVIVRKSDERVGKRSCSCHYRIVSRKSYQALFQGIGERNEVLGEKLGLLDIYGRDTKMPSDRRARLEKQLEAPAEWNDSRMVWDFPSLAENTKDIDGWNDLVGTSPEFRRGSEKMRRSGKSTRDLYLERRGHEIDELLKESARRKAQLEAQRREDSENNRGLDLYLKKMNSWDACLRKQKKTLSLVQK